jgi:DNA polymerase III subunit alpha
LKSPIDFHCHSTYSLLDGFGTPEDVAGRAVELGWGAACLTEHGWMGSAPAFYKACRARKIKPILGCELYVTPHENLGQRGKEYRWKFHHLTVLVLSAEGYHNLVAWTSFASQRENFYDRPQISLDAMEFIAPYPLHHNVVLSGCLSSELQTTLLEANGLGLNIGEIYVASMKSLFPHFYIEVQNHAHPKFLGKGHAQYEDMCQREGIARASLLKLAERTNTPVVLTNDSHFQWASQREKHLMMSLQKKSRGQGRMRVADYLKEYGLFRNFMQDMEVLAERTGLPKEVLDNAVEIEDAADIRLDPLDEFSYSIPFSGYDNPLSRIQSRCRKRLDSLVAKHGKAASDRFEMELGAMGDFAHYLLLMSDFIIAAQKQGILTNTRGSAANSLVCYCLRIHDIDPMPDSYNLLFSRFVNPARKKLPDIDIDIEKDRYEDFMRIVTERMSELEGEGQVVQICNYGTFANRTSFRLIADALGISKEEQDEITRLLPQMIDSGMVDEENDVYGALKHEYPEIYELASGVFDAIKSLSQHACGWVFGTRDRPLKTWVPQALIASSGSTVTAYNLKYLEEFGLVKGDFLRLRTLSVIQRCRRLLNQDSLSISDIPLDDLKTFKMLREGKTEGIFTLQGKENRKGCIEVEVQNVHDVIRAVAIYRPALTREGKHWHYNNRRKGTEVVKYGHPIAKKILGETFGIPVFQEQVMEICYEVGMTDAEVDDVHKAIKMAKGVGRGAREAFDEIEPGFFAACGRSGISERATERLWTNVRGSQGYGFNKGHATSYGILAVRAAYLKANYPAEFFTALLDVYPEKSKYIASARAERFQFLVPCVNRSREGFSLDRDSGRIRVGLSRIKGLGPVAIRSIIEGQPYSSYEDFRERVPQRAVNKTRVETLAAVGAFADMGIRATADDLEELRILSFTLKKPKAFKGISPKHTAARESESGWVHRGREKGADITEIRESVSKLFWIPPLPDNELLQLKASPWAQVKTYLLMAVDENGLPFHVMTNEDKTVNVEILKYIAKRLKGTAICLDGAVRLPFLSDGPLGFRFYGVTGASFRYDPQVFGPNATDRRKAALVKLHDARRRMKT